MVSGRTDSDGRRDVRIEPDIRDLGTGRKQGGTIDEARFQGR